MSSKWGDTMRELQQAEAMASIFGDLFLADLRHYREARLAEAGLAAVFPLWGVPTGELIREFIGLFFKTITACVSEQHLDRSFVGWVIDEDFLRDLSAHVDPCGENGEFHTFVFDGPLFSQPIAFEKGEIVCRQYTVPSSVPAGSDDYDCPTALSATASLFATGFWYCYLV